MLNFSNKLKIADFLKALSEEVYCVIKYDADLPNYYKNSDIDIFAYDLESVSKKILKEGQAYVEAGAEIKVHSFAENSHIQIDFYWDEVLDFRFDLINRLPAYSRIQIKPALFSVIIENRRSIQVGKGNMLCEIYVPAYIDDLLLRYIEYVSYYHIRADKIKHVDFIMKEADEADIAALLTKLHFYTALPIERCDEKKINTEFIKNNTKNLSKQKKWWRIFKGGM